jgi:hypothetical protein
LGQIPLNPQQLVQSLAPTAAAGAAVGCGAVAAALALPAAVAVFAAAAAAAAVQLQELLLLQLLVLLAAAAQVWNDPRPDAQTAAVETWPALFQVPDGEALVKPQTQQHRQQRYVARQQRAQLLHAHPQLLRPAAGPSALQA